MWNVYFFFSCYMWIKTFSSRAFIPRSRIKWGESRKMNKWINKCRLVYDGELFCLFGCSFLIRSRKFCSHQRVIIIYDLIMQSNSRSRSGAPSGADVWIYSLQEKQNPIPTIIISSNGLEVINRSMKFGLCVINPHWFVLSIGECVKERGVFKHVWKTKRT